MTLLLLSARDELKVPSVMFDDIGNVVNLEFDWLSGLVMDEAGETLWFVVN
jgi:hypothetical protein